MMKHHLRPSSFVICLLSFVICPSPVQAQEQTEQKRPTTIYNTPEEVLVTTGTGEKQKSRLVRDREARSGWAIKADPADKPVLSTFPVQAHRIAFLREPVPASFGESKAS